MQQEAKAGAGNAGDGAAWSGFLITAFAVVGLVGALSTYAAQIPFQRALARDAALDRAVATAGTPGSQAAQDALREALGDSADRVLGDPATVAARVAAERTRMLQSFGAESEDIGFRLRIVIAAFTAAAALFGVAILSVVRRAARP
jgi:hypothetical protein